MPLKRGRPKKTDKKIIEEKNRAVEKKETQPERVLPFFMRLGYFSGR